MQCPTCGKESSTNDAIYCPYCSKPLKLHKRTPLPIAAGVLTTIGSSIIIIAAVLSVISSLFYLIISYDYKISISFTSGYLLFIGVLGIIAFAFGLGGGVSIFKRTTIVTSIVGLSLMIASGVMLSASYIWIADLTNPLFPMSPIWIIGILTIILSILGLIFVAISRKEFS
jgi:hypothetical protein